MFLEAEGVQVFNLVGILDDECPFLISSACLYRNSKRSQFSPPASVADTYFDSSCVTGVLSMCVAGRLLAAHIRKHTVRAWQLDCSPHEML